MKGSIGLTEEQLAIALAMLTSPLNHKPLLNKVTNAEGHEVYEINQSFSSLVLRLALNKVPKSHKKPNEEVKDTEDKVKEDRRYQLDSIIMKIMKTKKSLPHNELIAEVFKKVNFPLETSTIKLRIESLIEKDYIKRNSENAAVYDYMA